MTWTGSKTRNQRLRDGFMVMSYVLTFLMGFGLAGVLMLMKFRRRRFVVPSRRIAASLRVVIIHMAKRVLNGSGFGAIFG